MAALRLLPHRVADARSVSWHRWWTERDGNRTELSALLAGWDYASHTTVGISVDLDEDALLASTGLDSMDDLEILAMADCLLAQQRFVATKPLREHQRGSTADVTVQLPPGQVAGSRPAVRPPSARTLHTGAGIWGCLPAGIANRFFRTFHPAARRRFRSIPHRAGNSFRTWA